MIFSLERKTALITGGGSGIGRAISLLFAAQGAHVFILDLDSQGMLDTAMAISEAGGKASTLHVDISDFDMVKKRVGEICENGYIDILVNNAGVAHVGNIENTEETDLERLFSVNVKGAYNCMKVVIPFMKSKGGAIVNMASVASMVGISERFAYSMTKAAMAGMSLSVAKDYLGYHIRCNCISPARVHTPFVDGFISKNYPGNEQEMFEKLSKTQPIGRMGKPEEIAYLALYLASDEAAFITGCDYPIDGGFVKLNN